MARLRVVRWYKVLVGPEGLERLLARAGCSQLLGKSLWGALKLQSWECT